MSDFRFADCACGVRIVSTSPDHEDVRDAVEAHNATPRHQQWRAVETFNEIHGRRSKGPCICKGGQPRNAA